MVSKDQIATASTDVIFLTAGIINVAKGRASVHLGPIPLYNVKAFRANPEIK